LEAAGPAQRGVVVLDMAGGSSLKRSYQQHMPIGAFGSRIALCVSCLHDVQSVPAFAARRKQSLQRLRRRKQGLCTLVWNELLNKIPADRTKSKADAGAHAHGAHGNDFLLRRVGS